MAYNIVEANGQTLIDLTSDTVTADTLVSGRTAHLASGERVTGTFEPVTGVKGNAETEYRTGNVNLTAANIGAATSAQGTKADSAVQTIKMNGNAVTKTSGVVDLGTVITAHQDISGKADKSATVSNVTYDTTNKKLTKTINGTTSDVVTTAQLKTDMALSKSDVGLGNVGNFKAVSTVASQGLTDTEKANARTNIGAGTSSFSGSYNDLTNKPTIPPFANNAGFHNSIYRGKNLGTSYTAEQKAAVKASTFDDLFVGDYWLINNIHWRIAHLNYYLNTGDIATKEPHLLVVPDESLANSYMNSTNTTTNAYVGSYMYTTTLLQDGTEASDSVFGKIKAAFGESNLLSIRQMFANAVDSNGNVSGWAWYNARCFLMNQCMVYGNKAWANGNNDGYNIGIDKSQLALFAHNPISINTIQTYWLRDVRSSAHFAVARGYGNAYFFDASGISGVRPVVLLS